MAPKIPPDRARLLAAMLAAAVLLALALLVTAERSAELRRPPASPSQT